MGFRIVHCIVQIMMSSKAVNASLVNSHLQCKTFKCIEWFVSPALRDVYMQICHLPLGKIEIELITCHRNNCHIHLFLK